MAGFSDDNSGINIVYAQNIDLSGGFPNAAQLLTDGQMMIASTALNAGGTHVNVGVLTSPDSSVTIGYSSPNITLRAGASIPTTFVGNSGSAVPSSNTLNVLGAGAVSVAGSGNTLTITVPSSGFTWTDQAGTFTAAKNNGYFCTAALTVNLPGSPAQGDTLQVYCDTASTVTIKASGSQVIRLAGSVSAAAGTAASSAIGSCIELTYRAADTQWCALDSVGNWTIT